MGYWPRPKNYDTDIGQHVDPLEERNLLSLIKGLFWLVVFTIFLAILGRIFLFEIAQTNTYAMVPNIMPGDTVLVLTRGKLGPGEVAMCKDPENPGQMVIGRIMGIPGSTFEMENNMLNLNGKRIDYTVEGPKLLYEENIDGEHIELQFSTGLEKVSGRVYNTALMNRAGNQSFAKTEIESGFFLIGDNRNRARDSREYGEVPIEDCIGSPFLVIWPGPDSGDFRFRLRFLQWIQ